MANTERPQPINRVVIRQATFDPSVSQEPVYDIRPPLVRMVPVRQQWHPQPDTKTASERRQEAAAEITARRELRAGSNSRVNTPAVDIAPGQDSVVADVIAHYANTGTQGD